MACTSKELICLCKSSIRSTMLSLSRFPAVFLVILRCLGDKGPPAASQAGLGLSDGRCIAPYTPVVGGLMRADPRVDAVAGRTGARADAARDAMACLAEAGSSAVPGPRPMPAARDAGGGDPESSSTCSPSPISDCAFPLRRRADVLMSTSSTCICVHSWCQESYSAVSSALAAILFRVGCEWRKFLTCVSSR